MADVVNEWRTTGSEALLDALAPAGIAMVETVSGERFRVFKAEFIAWIRTARKPSYEWNIVRPIPFRTVVVRVQ